MSFTRGTMHAATLLLVATFGVLGDARAVAQEPLPEEVAEYFTEDLVPRLAELYTPSADGSRGIDFDDSTELGGIVRVRLWTEGFRAGETDGAAVALSNEWVAPVTVDGHPVGLATVWINPATVKPELADFQPDAGIVTALAAAPVGAQLVRDQPNGAWFAVLDDTVTPLVSGHTTLTESLSLEDAQKALLEAEPPAPQATENGAQGVLYAGGVLLLVVGLLVVVVMKPARRRAAAAGPEEP